MAIPTPHNATILRPGPDAYGNPSSGWANPTEIPVRVYHISGADNDRLMLPADADIRMGDRVRVHGATYALASTPVPVRSPSATVLITAVLERVEGV